jgi:hypothetical protein
MSTKIYNAYKWNGTSFEVLLGKLKQLRIEFIEEISKELALYTENMTYLEILYKLQEETLKGYRSPFNLETSAVAFPVNGEIYLQFFGVSDKLRRRVFKGELTDYHYQNQTDKPSRVSYKEWEERRKFWDIVLPDEFDRPSIAGFSYNVCTKTDEAWVALKVREKGGCKKSTK